MTGIVLNVIRYNERHDIAHVYTRDSGRMSYLVRTGSTAGARRRRAMFHPLAVIDFEASRPRSSSAIATIHDVSMARVCHSILAEPAKSAIAMFMGEVLSRTIEQQEPDEALYRFVLSSVERLEAQQRGTANFHLCFLYRLGRYLGVQPDAEGYSEGAWFDMAEGLFTRGPSGRHTLPPQQARVIYLLSRMNYDNLHLFRFTREQRNMVLDTIIVYLRLHNSTLGSLKSPAVLRQIFG